MGNFDTAVAHDGLAVLPSRPVVLTVAFDTAPETPPDDLIAFVKPVGDSATTRTWELTDDAIAFGGYAIVHRMHEWTGTWQKSWSLGQQSVLRVLRELVHNEVDELSDRSARLLDALCGDWREPSDAHVAIDDLSHLDAILQRARTMIHRAGRTGFGVIDTTPGATTIGLLRAWSVALGDPTLAADDKSIVTLTEQGLLVGLRSTRSRIMGILEVAFQESSVSLVTSDNVIDLPSDEVVPLAWIVPEATSWRVRRVPEVLVWADVFAGVADARDCAAAGASSVRLNHDGSSVELHIAGG